MPESESQMQLHSGDISSELTAQPVSTKRNDKVAFTAAKQLGNNNLINASNITSNSYRISKQPRSQRNDFDTVNLSNSASV